MIKILSYKLTGTVHKQAVLLYLLITVFSCSHIFLPLDVCDLSWLCNNGTSCFPCLLFLVSFLLSPLFLCVYVPSNAKQRSREFGNAQTKISLQNLVWLFYITWHSGYYELILSFPCVKSTHNFYRLLQLQVEKNLLVNIWIALCTMFIYICLYI